MAPSAEEFGDERFDDYNPHPFQGGYDIQKTYGQSLPPSSKICYPISSPTPSSVARPAPTSSKDDNSDRYGIQDNFALPVYNYPLLDREASSDINSHRSASTPFDEIHGSCTVRDNPLNWAVDYLFTYFRSYGDKRAEAFSYGNLNYAYEKHQPAEILTIQSNPYEFYQEQYQDEEHFGVFQEREDKIAEIPKYNVADYAHQIRPPSEGLFSFFDEFEDKRIEEFSYQIQQPQEVLSIQLDPPQNFAFEEFYRCPLNSSKYESDHYKWQQPEDSYVDEAFSHEDYTESLELNELDFDPTFEQKTTDYDYLKNFDFLGIFGTNETSHAVPVDIDYDEKSLNNDFYEEQSRSQNPAGNQYDEMDDTLGLRVDQSYFFGQQLFFGV